MRSQDFRKKPPGRAPVWSVGPFLKYGNQTQCCREKKSKKIMEKEGKEEGKGEEKQKSRRKETERDRDPLQ